MDIRLGDTTAISDLICIYRTNIMEDSSVKPIAATSSFSKLVSECSGALVREEGENIRTLYLSLPATLYHTVLVNLCVRSSV